MINNLLDYIKNIGTTLNVYALIKKIIAKQQSLDDLQSHIHIHCGEFNDVDINLISIMRDESFFLEPFFDYYRELGVQQFLILDDRSEDSTPVFLKNQRDCVVLKTGYAFGENLTVRLPSRKVSTYRAGILLRSVIARKFCMKKYAVVVDADEFLILPSRFGNLHEFIGYLDANKIRGVAANMIDFYPESILDLRGEETPRTFSDLARLYPFFDGVPLLRFDNDKRPTRIGDRASFRLITDFEKETLPVQIQQQKRPRAQDVAKCPVLYWDEHVFLAGSHHASAEISRDILLALAHFVFTHDFFARTQRSAARGEHAGGASKYKLFQELSEHMLLNGKKFTCDKSLRFTGNKQLETLNLLGTFIAKHQ